MNRTPQISEAPYTGLHPKPKLHMLETLNRPAKPQPRTLPRPTSQQPPSEEGKGTLFYLGDTSSHIMLCPAFRTQGCPILS